eukprot:TRINITY_DN5316_c0_g1_i2.p1 TRINITY_DN5316_c0_g1~~TRINITY_DN5316_c0_g1_i2.p1  ORF type:complete len:477 (+),score=109.15 TRINITY_DN5316_c0_g1_i2:73-1503(+)
MKKKNNFLAPPKNGFSKVQKGKAPRNRAPSARESTLFWDTTEIAEDLNKILSSENFEDAEIIQIEKKTKNKKQKESKNLTPQQDSEDFDDQWRVSGFFHPQIDDFANSDGSDDDSLKNQKFSGKKSFTPKNSNSGGKKFRASAALDDVLSPDEIKAIQDSNDNYGEIDDQDEDFSDSSDESELLNRSELRRKKSINYRESAALDDLLRGEDLAKAQRRLHPGWRVSVINMDFNEVMKNQDVESYLKSHLLGDDLNSRKDSSKKFRVSAALEDLVPQVELSPQIQTKPPQQQDELPLEQGFDSVRDSLSDAIRSVINVVKDSESNNVELFARSCRRLKENVEDIDRRAVDLTSKEGVELGNLVKKASRAIYDLLGAIVSNARLNQRGALTNDAKQKVVGKLRVVRDLRIELAKFSRESLLEKKKAEERKLRDIQREKRRLERAERRKQGERLVFWKSDVDNESHTNRISIVVEKFNN